MSFWLMIVGVLGSVVVTIKRFGVGKLKIFLAIWAVAFLSLFLLYTGDDLSSLGWALISYPAIILGSILVIVYSFRNAE